MAYIQDFFSARNSSRGSSGMTLAEIRALNQANAGNEAWMTIPEFSASDYNQAQDIADLRRSLGNPQMSDAELIEKYTREPIPVREGWDWGDLLQGLAIPGAYLGAGLATGAFSGLGTAATTGGSMAGAEALGAMGTEVGLGLGEAAAAGGAAGAAGYEAALDPLLAGGGEVGSGYAASAPGAAAAGGSSSLAGIWSQIPEEVKALGSGAVGQWLSKNAGTLIGAGLGAYASNQQSEAYERLARDYMAMGAPSRARYEASFAPGFTMDKDPGYTDALNQTAKATLHGLSVGGNPADSPNAWSKSLSDIYEKTAYPALQNYRGMNANAGGISTFAGAAPGASSASINSGRGVYDSIGAGAADIFNPPKTLAETLAELRKAGFYGG